MHIKLGNREIGDYKPAFIIAELSANHNHDYRIAEESIKAAKDAGADAIKLQTYTPDTITIDCDNEYFRINHDTLWDGKTLYELYGEAYTPWEWQPKLKKVADELDIMLFSSPFDNSAVDFLETIDVPAYKIASFEITDLPLIKYAASKGKPIILSTGIATEFDIEDAVKACRSVGNNNIILLKCTSAYPAPISEANLRTIPDLAARFGVLSGLSDHTCGIVSPVVAISQGACIIEKHFITDKSIGGPDSSFSLDMNEFKEMVQAIRDAEMALGDVNYTLSEKVSKNRIFARSLFITRDVKQGDLFTSENLKSIRPGYGLSPKYIDAVIGKHAAIDIARGTPLNWDLIITEDSDKGKL